MRASSWKFVFKIRKRMPVCDSVSVVSTQCALRYTVLLTQVCVVSVCISVCCELSLLSPGYTPMLSSHAQCTRAAVRTQRTTVSYEEMIPSSGQPLSHRVHVWNMFSCGVGVGCPSGVLPPVIPSLASLSAVKWWATRVKNNWEKNNF